MPVVDMLACSPPLPLAIETIAIGDPDDITTEDEEAIILALEQCDRLRHVRLRIVVGAIACAQPSDEQSDSYRTLDT